MRLVGADRFALGVHAHAGTAVFAVPIRNRLPLVVARIEEAVRRPGVAVVVAADRGDPAVGKEDEVVQVPRTVHRHCARKVVRRIRVVRSRVVPEVEDLAGCGPVA